ncbi:SUMF1/EgtB/PvdO family nonheme iron enzyme [Candidatus Saganbacteria bacterium]|nr:SUMF1/EgtB/PvdO family nonheme iron enzyme [Candidatus Saganbacteria bacterium]
MAGFEVKLRAGETRNWGALRQRATLAGDPRRIRAGDDLSNLAELIALRGTRQIALPEMIALSQKLSIMKPEVTVGLFKQVMKGYEIIGHNADKLKALIDEPKAAETALTYVRLLDAREFAKWLSAQTGRKFRVQTENEWSKARDQLSGNNWTWTETKYSGDTYVLRHLGSDYRDFNGPEDRCSSDAVRLVEDI